MLRLWRQERRPGPDPEFTLASEAAALTLLERAGFPAPRLIAMEARAGRGAPALIMTRLPGRPPGGRTLPTPRMLEQLAAAAHAIHSIRPPWPGIPRYRPYHDLADPRPPRRSTRPALWARAFAVLARKAPRERTVFIHRDFHPGNTLWVRGRMTGVVDWHTASRGPAGVDLGHMRWNLALRHGARVADRFLERYRELAGAGRAHDTYWDFRTLVDLLPDADPTPAALARLEPYLEGLLART